jgi:hypothetical protein
MKLVKDTYIRANIIGNDSDKIDFVGFLNSQPEGADFEVRNISIETNYYEDRKEEASQSL